MLKFPPIANTRHVIVNPNQPRCSHQRTNRKLKNSHLFEKLKVMIVNSQADTKCEAFTDTDEKNKKTVRKH